MIDTLNRFKIPTLLGLSIIILGLGGGIFLVLSGNQTLTSQASQNQIPQKNSITFANITDTSATLSWKTALPASSFVRYGQIASIDQPALDVRDSSSPKPRTIHYVTMNNLLPQTKYQVQIHSGRFVYPEILTFTTAPPTSNQNGFKPVIGKVIQANTPALNGIVYLSIAGAYTQSSLIKDLGNFVIPISTMQKQNVTGVFTPELGSIAKLTAITDDGQGTAIFKLQNTENPIGVLQIGKDIDLTTQLSIQKQPTQQELNIYDLNNDLSINANDHAIVLRNLGKNPKDIRADINKNGVVDAEDLALISQHISEQPKPTDLDRMLLQK